MVVFWSGLSFLWVIGGVALLAALIGLRALLAYRRLRQEAEGDWDYQVSENMQDLRLTKAAYVRAYCKVNAPRAPLYLAGGLFAILISTPVIFSLINVALWGLWKSTDESRVFEPGYLVWQFFIFFLIIASWALIGAYAARLFHAREPGLMRDELAYERAGFMPEKRLTIGANPAHIEAGLDGGVNRDTYRALFEGALGLNYFNEKNWNGSDHNCDIYSDGSDMKICVHSTKKGNVFGKDTHPFFFDGEHARSDDKEARYTLIFKTKHAHKAFEKISALGLSMSKTVGDETSRFRSFSHKTFDIFLYDERN